MAKASWNGVVVAEGADVERVEGNAYFRPEDVRQELLRPSRTHTVCAWKGDCSYFDVVVDGQVNADAAWVYVDPKPAAAHVRGRIAFWRGVKVEA